MEAPILYPLELVLHDSGCHRVALVVRGIDGQDRRLYALQVGRGIIISRRIPLIQKIVGISGERSREPLIKQCVSQFARWRELLIRQRSPVGGNAEEYIGHLERARLRRV